MDQHTESAFQVMSISLLRESPTNPRRHFNADALEELASNVKRQGVLLPLLVRPNDLGFEIIAGARRFRAAGLAGLAEVPVRICQMSDAEVLEVQVIENLQREDIHPVEEAEGFQALIDKYGYTSSTLAERCSRSESYIQKRLALARLVEEVKQAFLEGKIELGHALLLCRLSAKDQRAEFGLIFREETRWDGKSNKFVVFATTAMSVSQLRLHIEQNVFLDLSGAPWKKDDKSLVKKAGSCNSCVKRTGSNLVLFDDAKKGDHCLDRACWALKMQAHLAATQKRFEAEGKPLVKIATSWSDDLAKDVVPSHELKMIASTGKLKPCKHKEDALVVHGSQLGMVVPICRDKRCTAHWGSWERTGKSKSEKTFEQVWSEKRDRLQSQLDLQAKRALFRQILADSTVLDEGIRLWLLLASALIDQAHHDGGIAVCAALGIDVDKSSGFPNPRATLDEYAAGLELPQLVRLCFALCHFHRLMPHADIALLRDMISELGHDSAAIEANVTGGLLAEFERKYERAKAAQVNAKSSKGKKGNA